MVTVTKDFTVPAATVWERIGKFTNLSWTGNDPWEFSEDGKQRTLKEHGLKEELVALSDCSYTYRMVEGPFTNFQVTVSVAEKGETACTASYTATGDLDAEATEIVRQGAAEAFDALGARLG